LAGFLAPVAIAVTLLLALGTWWWKGTRGAAGVAAAARRSEAADELAEEVKKEWRDEANGAADLTAVKSGPAITDRWRLTINDVSSEVLQLQNNSMSHSGYTSRAQENLPPSFRIGMSVACSLLDPATPTTSEVRARFLSFLGQSPVMDLIREVTVLGDGLAWRGRDDNPRHNFAAILSSPDTKEAPVAWARLLPPEEITRRYGRDLRCAYFVLHVEPRSADGSPAPAASLLAGISVSARP
jgi:hypothetical protein